MASPSRDEMAAWDRETCRELDNHDKAHVSGRRVVRGETGRDTPFTSRRRRGRGASSGAPATTEAPARIAVRANVAGTLRTSALMAAIPLVHGRGGGSSLYALALEVGNRSPQMLVVLTHWTVTAIWTLLTLTRSTTRLIREPGEPPVFVQSTALRPVRRIDLRRVRRVVLVSYSLLGSTLPCELLVDEAGRVLARPVHRRGFWQRDDSRTLLQKVGIEVTWDHQVSRPSQIEAAYPGATRWHERHPARYALAVIMTIAASVAVLVWLFSGSPRAA